MFKYIKWEMINILKKNYIYFISFIILMVLSLIFSFPEDSTNNSNNLLIYFLWISYLLMWVITFILVFLRGTLVVIDTFKNRTFLLESMIPYGPKKILLSKYLLAFIVNSMYGIFLFASTLIFIIKTGGLESLNGLFQYINNMDLSLLIKNTILVFINSFEISAAMIMVYVIIRSVRPSKKPNFILSIFIWWAMFYFIDLFKSSILGNYLDINMMQTSDYIFSIIVSITLIIGYFFITAKLIKDRLEVY